MTRWRFGKRATRLAALGVTILALGGCAHLRSETEPPRLTATVVSAREGVARDIVETSAVREGYRVPIPGDPENPEDIPPGAQMFYKFLDRREFPMYRGQWANQVPLDPQFKLLFRYSVEGDSTVVEGQAWVRTREPPLGDWNEHRLATGHALEEIRAILDDVRALAR
ncbi:MAG: hypothetical protein R3B81_07125 [bacterium]